LAIVDAPTVRLADLSSKVLGAELRRDNGGGREQIDVLIISPARGRRDWACSWCPDAAPVQCAGRHHSPDEDPSLSWKIPETRASSSGRSPEATRRLTQVSGLALRACTMKP
jgi:hypothetical protein